MKRAIYFLGVVLLLQACATNPATTYFEQPTTGVQTGGVRMIPIQTPKGTFNVWTKRVGNNPRIKVLLLHGGPGATHEYYEVVDSFFPAAGIEYYFYDQLGSYYSDQPNDADLCWSGWLRRSPARAICTARTAVTWPCTTISRPGSAA